MKYQTFEIASSKFVDLLDQVRTKPRQMIVVEKYSWWYNG